MAASKQMGHTDRGDFIRIVSDDVFERVQALLAGEKASAPSFAI
jgi:hypothetical protein